MKNYMREVAKMLGVEFGEDFEVNYPTCPNINIVAKICENGLKIVGSDSEWVYVNKLDFNCNSMFSDMLRGVCKIVPKPWKPRLNDRYYSIGPGGVLEPGVWVNDFIDVAMYKLGNCYRTVEEANNNSKKWIGFYNSRERIEI